MSGDPRTAPSAAKLTRHAVAIAHQLRRGETAAGNEDLTGFIEALEASLATGSIPVAGLLPLLQAALAAQATGDFLRLADVLEHQLPPRLDADL